MVERRAHILRFLRNGLVTTTRFTARLLFAGQVMDVAGVWKSNLGPKWLVGAGVAAVYVSLKARNDLVGNVTVDHMTSCDSDDVLHGF